MEHWDGYRGGWLPEVHRQGMQGGCLLLQLGMKGVGREIVGSLVIRIAFAV